MTDTKYHKIYKQFYGKLPFDEDDRVYDIHHIDGNNKNNDPSNLIAVSIKEHFNIHFLQGDHGACFAISLRMKISPEEKSRLNTIQNLKRVENGTHHFLNGEVATKMNLERVKNGTHPWTSGEVQRRTCYERLLKGTHPSQDKVTCPHCKLIGAKYNMVRYHFDKCKKRVL